MIWIGGQNKMKLWGRSLALELWSSAQTASAFHFISNHPSALLCLVEGCCTVCMWCSKWNWFNRIQQPQKQYKFLMDIKQCLMETSILQYHSNFNCSTFFNTGGIQCPSTLFNLTASVEGNVEAISPGLQNWFIPSKPTFVSLDCIYL